MQQGGHRQCQGTGSSTGAGRPKDQSWTRLPTRACTVPFTHRAPNARPLAQSRHEALNPMSPHLAREVALNHSCHNELLKLHNWILSGRSRKDGRLL